MTNRKVYILFNLVKDMKSGKAYGFFNCKASKEEIEAELPTIRKLAQTPSQLELSLIEGVRNLKGEIDLIELAKEAETAGIKYVMEATYPTSNNKQTAGELSSILNQAYQSPLYSKGETFEGNIVYKDKGKYIFLG